ncbi:hypothetical protein GQ53DRAFT_877686 [Thozetella sp. PMI_491]|nr:hypothetical protein GQ53DRAFT_877686 [Thozetella sp. PMI_491]
MFSKSTISALLALASTAAASSLNINNWCSTTVYIYQSNGGKCNSGPNAICQGSAGAAPFVVAPGQIRNLGWIQNGLGTSVKMSKGDVNFNSGILQFEYNFTDGMYWDLSDLDGRGAGIVGSPFFNDNIKISPTGAGEGQGTCVKIRCPAGKLCVDSYQNPDDVKTRWCPLNTGDFWIDLCQPQDLFVNKREISFQA